MFVRCDADAMQSHLVQVVNVMPQEAQAVQPKEAHHAEREVPVVDLSSI